MPIKTFNDYYEVARVLETDYAGSKIEINSLRPYDANKLVHYAIGLTTEVIELQQARNHNRPILEQVLELGDICWFSALAAAELGVLPDLAQLHKYPTQGLPIIYELVEDFASSIKSALAYGSPIRKSHQSLGRWREIPAEIFMRTVAIGNAVADNRCVLTKNLDKLRARFPEAFSATRAINRDEVKELRAVEPGTITQRLNAQNTSGSVKA